jgi:hypothetical protein
MAFDAQHVSESTTRAVLLGTSGGRVYETVVEASGKAALPHALYALESAVDDAPCRVAALHVVSVGLRHGGGSSGVGVDVVGGAPDKASSSGLGFLGPGSSLSSAGSGSAGGRDGSHGRDGDHQGDGSSKDAEGRAEGRLLVVCATDAPTRLYSFLGGPTYADLFGAAEQQGSAAGAASTWTFTELGALGNGQQVQLHRC